MGPRSNFTFCGARAHSAHWSGADRGSAANAAERPSSPPRRSSDSGHTCIRPFLPSSPWDQGPLSCLYSAAHTGHINFQRDVMRPLITLALALPLVSGCAAWNDKVDASRQDRCERANWKEVGLRDGATGTRLMADRYEQICGDMFKPGPYKEGFQEGLTKKPPAPGM